MINLITCDKISKDASVMEQRDHVASEYNEFSEAYMKYMKDGSGKNMAHMVEEAIDCANSLLTFVDKVMGDKLDVALLMVACKNYLRGYHDTDPLGELELSDILSHRRGKK